MEIQSIMRKMVERMLLNKLARKLTAKLLIQNIIPEDYSDIYIYGFELLLSFLFSTSVIVLAGVLCGRLLQTIVFLTVFIVLRSFTGGYHALQYWFCSVVTFSVFGLVLLISEFVKVSMFFYILLSLIGIVTIALVVPIENSNKPLSEGQKKKYKIISFTLFVIFVALGAVINYIDNSVGSVVFFTLIADLLLLFIKNRKERGIKKHENLGEHPC